MLQEKAAPLPLDLPPPAAAQPTATSSGTRSTKTTRATQALLLLLLFVGYELVLSPALVRIGGTSASASSTGAAAAVAHKDGRQPPAWAPCPGFEADPRFTCATQEVPLDHAKGLHGGVATIALSRYSVPGSSLEGRKTLFVNPGGPGGSGHAYTFRAAPSFSRVVEDEYDIIGFDPRGVNQTLPRMACFDRLREEREFLKALAPALDSLDVGTEAYLAAVREKDRENQLVAQRCEIEAGTAGRHMGTTTVVHDIAYLSALIDGKDAPINFAGWSYGTVIGQVLWSAYPDRVGRILIDGVCDIVNWFETPQHQWGRSDYHDSEKTFSAFLTSCAAAGPSRCALAREDSTHDSLMAAVDAELEALNERPAIIRDAQGKGLGLLHGAQVKGWIFGKLYKPAGWADFAKDLDALLRGNGSAIYTSELLPATTPADEEGSTAYSNPAVECSDSVPYPANLTDADVAQMIADENAWEAKHVSRHFAASGVTACPRWGNMREPERYTGPWNNNLSNSVLIVGNTADPITSLQHARTAHKLQPQSKLIHHDGFGHCSTAMPSLCTALAIRNYFVHGALPEDGLTCKPDGVLFPELVLQEAGGQAQGGQYGALSAEEVDLLESLATVGEALHGGFKRGDGRWGV